MKQDDYSNEVKFQVGQRVEVDLKEIKPEERNCTKGVITTIYTQFPRTPKMRKIWYQVRFDEDYIKKEFQLAQGIPEIRCTGDKLQKMKGGGIMAKIKLLIMLIVIIGAGCYTPRVYVRNFDCDYMEAREAALFALREQGMRLHKSKQLSSTRTVYVARKGLDPQLWGQEIFLWVEDRREKGTDVAFQDIWVSQKADIHREIFSFIDRYVALNFKIGDGR